MSDDCKGFLIFCGIVGSVISSGVGGCCYTSRVDAELKRDMAKEGYYQHVESLPGQNSPATTWRPNPPKTGDQ